jgi:hypothetical protein
MAAIPTGFPEHAPLADQQAWIEAQPGIGHPGDLLAKLKKRIENGVEDFSDVQDDWLAVMWALDIHRIAGVPPRGMGNPTSIPAKQLESAYKKKGNWFAEIIALLLANQTGEDIAPRVQVQGFSQTHQIDVAWPHRKVDVRVCTETKVTGAPAYGSTKARGPMADWTNRRKELKFAATDLKLARRDKKTKINNWGVWRGKAPPMTFFLWGARVERSAKTQKTADTLRKMSDEVQALVDTYLDGAGVFAWQENAQGTGYEPLPLPGLTKARDLDNVLNRIATEIEQLREAAGGEAPPPELPPARAVDPQLRMRIAPDSED